MIQNENQNLNQEELNDCVILHRDNSLSQGKIIRNQLEILEVKNIYKNFFFQMKQGEIVKNEILGFEEIVSVKKIHENQHILEKYTNFQDLKKNEQSQIFLGGEKDLNELQNLQNSKKFIVKEFLDQIQVDQSGIIQFLRENQCFRIEKNSDISSTKEQDKILLLYSSIVLEQSIIVQVSLEDGKVQIQEIQQEGQEFGFLNLNQETLYYGKEEKNNFNIGREQIVVKILDLSRKKCKIVEFYVEDIYEEGILIDCAFYLNEWIILGIHDQLHFWNLDLARIIISDKQINDKQKLIKNQFIEKLDYQIEKIFGLNDYCYIGFSYYQQNYVNIAQLIFSQEKFILKEKIERNNFYGGNLIENVQIQINHVQYQLNFLQSQNQENLLLILVNNDQVENEIRVNQVGFNFSFFEVFENQFLGEKGRNFERFQYNLIFLGQDQQESLFFLELVQEFGLFFQKKSYLMKILNNQIIQIEQKQENFCQNLKVGFLAFQEIEKEQDLWLEQLQKNLGFQRLQAFAFQVQENQNQSFNQVQNIKQSYCILNFGVLGENFVQISEQQIQFFRNSNENREKKNLNSNIGLLSNQPIMNKHYKLEFDYLVYQFFVVDEKIENGCLGAYCVFKQVTDLSDNNDSSLKTQEKQQSEIMFFKLGHVNLEFILYDFNQKILGKNVKEEDIKEYENEYKFQEKYQNEQQNLKINDCIIGIFRLDFYIDQIKYVKNGFLTCIGNNDKLKILQICKKIVNQEQNISLFIVGEIYIENEEFLEFKNEIPPYELDTVEFMQQLKIKSFIKDYQIKQLGGFESNIMSFLNFQMVVLTDDNGLNWYQVGQKKEGQIMINLLSSLKNEVQFDGFIGQIDKSQVYLQKDKRQIFRCQLNQKEELKGNINIEIQVNQVYNGTVEVLDVADSFEFQQNCRNFSVKGEKLDNNFKLILDKVGMLSILEQKEQNLVQQTYL
ncbi:hypothetical protein PPERSA_05273 [Pseudocohnilembus persalinus]|uniref:Uncharacterized protein n=1 Tax=Pseudocohnilembus persalinus TaxID=266149 RepID=A0A0V0R5Y5_PSEPJ|nr:hypothetical protein PPERSA_05273 [Pseudocohnilembus persalinus]|eukprot:KRX09881.1 hypothetical protein PPERSA_05273 [Pseudocohnilembus persalinus]